jgi:hypothetical protein
LNNPAWRVDARHSIGRFHMRLSGCDICCFRITTGTVHVPNHSCWREPDTGQHVHKPRQGSDNVVQTMTTSHGHHVGASGQPVLRTLDHVRRQGGTRTSRHGFPPCARAQFQQSGQHWSRRHKAVQDHVLPRCKCIHFRCKH